MSYKTDFIDLMVDSGVLTFGDFTTKSGRKTPFFINTGNYKTGAQIARLGEFYAQAIATEMNSDFDLMYGPAYKGIPLAVTASVALANKHNRDVRYCFNRKEAKDHGEGGSLIGSKPQDGDRVLIIEDVVTAGTSVRESIPLLKSIADVQVTTLVVSVDRMERGQGKKTSLEELACEFGIRTIPIVTIDEIVEYLYNKEIAGRVLIDDAMLERIKAYRKQYGNL